MVVPTRLMGCVPRDIDQQYMCQEILRSAVRQQVCLPTLHQVTTDSQDTCLLLEPKMPLSQYHAFLLLVAPTTSRDPGVPPVVRC